MIKMRWKHDFFSHLVSLGPGLLSCDVKCIINWHYFVYYVKTTETRHDMTLLDTWCYLHQWHMSMASFFAKSRWLEEGATWLFGHVLPVLASHDTDGIIKSTIVFVSSWSSKWDTTWLFLSVIWHCWHWHQHYVISVALSIPPLYSLGQENWNSVQHNLLVR